MIFVNAGLGKGEEIDSAVGNIANEKAVANLCTIAGAEQINCGSRDLRAVVTEDAIDNQQRVICVAAVFNRNCSRARRHVISINLTAINSGIASAPSFDAATIGIMNEAFHP